MNKEAGIQKWARDRLQNEYGDYCVYIKYPAGQYSTRGVSDLIFCIHGLYVAIEVKTSVGALTVLQSKFLYRITIAGGISRVIYGKDEQAMTKLIRAINSERGI